MNSSRIKKSGRKKNRSNVEESEHESPAKRLKIEYIAKISSNFTHQISQIDPLPESLKIILNNSVERDIIHTRQAKVYYDGWTALYFNKFIYVWKYNEGEVYIYNDLPTDEDPLNSSLIQIFPGSDSSHPSLLVVYPSGNCYFRESLKINSLFGKISLHKYSKCVNLQRIKDSHFLLLSSDMTLYHITTNPTKGFSWIELSFTYSYLPVITKMIPLFPYYPSYINCYNYHNLFIESNQIIIINNQYITRLLINDDKEMNNITCTGQYDVIKKGIPTITSIENNNNENTPNEVTIVDTIVDKNLLYILIGCQQYNTIQKQETLAYFLMTFDISKNKDITLIQTVCVCDKYKWDNNINNRLINSEIVIDSFDQLYIMIYDVDDNNNNNNKEVVNAFICNRNKLKNEKSFDMIKLDYFKDIYGYSSLTKNSNTIMMILTKCYGYITIRLPVHIRSEIGIGDMSNMSSYNKLDNCFQSYLKNEIDIMTSEDKNDETVEWNDIVMKYSDNLVDAEPILPSLQYKNILSDNNNKSQQQQQQQLQEFYTNQQVIGEGIKKKLDTYQAYLNYLKKSELYPKDAEIQLKLLSNYEILLLSRKFHENYSKIYSQQQEYSKTIEVIQQMMKIVVSDNNNNNNNSNNNIELQFYTSLSQFPKLISSLLNLQDEYYYLDETPTSATTTNRFTYFPITVITKILVDMFKCLIDIRKNVCNMEYDVIFKESPFDRNSKLIWTNSNEIRNAFSEYLYNIENEMNLQKYSKDLTDLYREIGNIMLSLYEDNSDKLKEQLFKFLIDFGGNDNNKTIKFAESIKYFKALIKMIENNYSKEKIVKSKIEKEKYKSIIKNYFVTFEEQNFAYHYINYHKNEPYKYLTFVNEIPVEIEKFLIDNNNNDILPLFYQLRKQYEKCSDEYQSLACRISDNNDLKQRYLCLSTLNHYIAMKNNNKEVVSVEENEDENDNDVKLNELKNDIRITECQNDFEEILHLVDDSVFSIEDYIEKIKRYIQNNRNEIENIRKLFKIVVVVVFSCNESVMKKKEYFDDILIFVVKKEQNLYDKYVKLIKKKFGDDNYDKNVINNYIQDNISDIKELLLFQVINELKNNLKRDVCIESFDRNLTPDLKALCMEIVDKALLI